MKKNTYKAISIISLALAAVACLGAITVTGGGFMDLSNIARYILLGSAAIFTLTAVITGKMSRKK
ncbi:MAG: hypothetical protein GX061_00995 [Eubacteriaceae bacterium]|jgi:hypothetical protein|nr:hypothetical protein [Eubacteriaceae bacterium]